VLVFLYLVFLIS